MFAFLVQGNALNLSLCRCLSLETKPFNSGLSIKIYHNITFMILYIQAYIHT